MKTLTRIAAALERIAEELHTMNTRQPQPAKIIAPASAQKPAKTAEAPKILTRRPGYSSKTRWSKAESDLLVDLYEKGLPTEEILKRFPNRTAMALRKRIHYMGYYINR